MMNSLHPARRPLDRETMAKSLVPLIVAGAFIVLATAFVEAVQEGRAAGSHVATTSSISASKPDLERSGVLFAQPPVY